MNLTAKTALPGLLSILAVFSLMPMACSNNPSGPSPAPTPTPLNCPFPNQAGNTTPGPSLFTTGAGFLLCTQVTVTQYAGLQSLSVYLTNSPTGQFDLALYSDNSGPNTLIVQGTAQAAVTGWNILSVAPTYLAPGTYWIACEVQSGTEVAYSAGGSTNYVAQSWGSFPSPYPSGGVGVADSLSLYLSYCLENTPTFTLTPTFSPTSTRTPSFTPTGTPTSSPTITWTPTKTSTPTVTSSPTITRTPTDTPIFTYTSTATTTPTSYLTPVPTVASWPVTYPGGIAVDGNGYVYVVDGYNTLIRKFTSLGSPVTSWGGSGTLPTGLAVDSSSSTIYVANGGSNGNIQYFDPNGNLLGQFGVYNSAATGYGTFKLPYSVALDGSGNIYVADYLNYNIQKFSGPTTASFVTQWSSTLPESVAADGLGNVFVTSGIMNKYTNTGGAGTPASWLSDTGDLADVAVDGHGNVYASNQSTGCIQRYSVNGVLTGVYGRSSPAEFNSPGSLAVNSAGTTVWVSDYGNNRVVAFIP